MFAAKNGKNLRESDRIRSLKISSSMTGAATATNRIMDRLFSKRDDILS